MTTSAVLAVGSAFPDPPFEVSVDPPRGIDIELTRAVAAEIGRKWELHRYGGADFDGIFAGLDTGTYDVVASGATVTDRRRQLARFCDPYLRSGQSLVVNPTRHPEITSTGHLDGLTLGVQSGNTSEPVARRLHADGKIAEVKVYAYDEIRRALDDVETGTIAAFMKLEPVMAHLTASCPALRIVQTGITDELLALAVGSGDTELADRINDAQRRLSERGAFAGLAAEWLSSSDPEATRMLL